MIDILMATYNGGRYIRNQILSLQQQTYEDWRLLVRDDGSSDNTLEIVKSFMDNDPRIILIKDDLGNLGAGKCFLELTKYAQADYVMFCDQDDIWFEKKIQMLHNAAVEKLIPERPGFVYCDGYAYSDKLGLITASSISRVHAKNLRELLFLNAGYQGCSIFFNRSLCKMLANYKADYFYMHDDVTTLIAHTFGDVYFINKSLMLYRQHEGNVTGNIQFGLMLFLKRVFSGAPVISDRHYKEKDAFYNAYRNDMNDSDEALFKEYLRFPFVGFLRRVQIVVSNGFTEGGSFIRLLVKVLLRRPMND